MKKKLTIILFIAFNACAFAQKIQFSDGKVFSDGKAILSYKITMMGNEYTFYTLNTTDEVLNIKCIRNGVGGATTKVHFPQGRIDFDSTIWFGVNTKPILKRLVAEGVILKDGSIDTKKAIEFSDKYEVK